MQRLSAIGSYTGILAISAVTGFIVAALVALGTLDPTVLAAIVGLVGAGACLAMAIARFDVFLYTLLAVRPALDGLNQGTQESAAGMLSPSVAVGLAFVGASGVWLATRFHTRRLVLPSPISWAWLALVAAASLSCLVSEYPSVSIAATLRLTAAALMFVVLEQALATRLVSPSGILRAVMASGVIVVGWTLMQIMTGTGAQDPWTGLTRVTGPFVHPSVLAKFLVVIALALASSLLWPRAASGRRPAAAVGALCLVTLCLGLTYTRVAWLACGLALGYLLWRKDWRLVPLFGSLGIVLAASIPSIYARISDLWNTPPPAPGAPDNSLAWRISFWEHLLPMARMSPLNGRGLDVIPLIGGQKLAAHNIWVQSAVEMGLIGFAALTGLVLCIAVTLSRRQGPGGHPLTAAAAAVALAMLSMSFSENLLNETTTLWYVSCILATGIYLAAKPANKAPESIAKEQK